MSVDTLVPVDTIHEAYAFSGNDRCDGDKGVMGYRGVVVAEQAYHRWTRRGKDILLCNHHNGIHQEALFIDGWDVESHPHADTLGQPMDINHVD